MSVSGRQLGVILAGGMRSHQENYAAAFLEKGCRLLAVGVADGLDEAEAMRHAELATALGVPLLPLEAALVVDGADIASVCVGMPHRARVAGICARAGLHLYLDKPLAGSVADAEAIAASVAAAGIEAQVFSHVTADWAGAARAAVRAGRLGRIVALHADMLMAKGVPAPVPPRPRREAAEPSDFPDDSAKRELADMGNYPVSLAAWLLERRALAVEAVTANHFFAEHLERDVEDYAALLVEFDGGITASITCGRVGWHAWRRPFLARVTVVGTDDTLVFDSEPAELLVTSAGGMAPPRNGSDPMEMWLSTRVLPRPVPRVSTHAIPAAASLDVAAFIATLSGGERAGIGVAEAAHHCAIIAAAYRAAAAERGVGVAGSA